MVGLNRRQGREFTLDGSVEEVGRRRRTRRLNRRKRRHLASESSLWVRSYCRDDEPKGGCLAVQHLRFREPKVGQLTPVDWEAHAMHPGADQERHKKYDWDQGNPLKATKVRSLSAAGPPPAESHAQLFGARPQR